MCAAFLRGGGDRKCGLLPWAPETVGWLAPSRALTTPTDVIQFWEPRLCPKPQMSRNLGCSSRPLCYRNEKERNETVYKFGDKLLASHLSYPAIDEI